MRYKSDNLENIYILFLKIYLLGSLINYIPVGEKHHLPKNSIRNLESFPDPIYETKVQQPKKVNKDRLPIYSLNSWLDKLDLHITFKKKLKFQNTKKILHNYSL